MGNHGFSRPPATPSGARYDQYFDKSFGIASAVHFRLVGASVLLCATLLTVALVPHGITQVPSRGTEKRCAFLE